MSTLDKVCASYLKTLCQDISQRCVGSDGNRQATRFVEKTLAAFGWKTQSPGFDVIDWHDGGATLTAGDKNFNAKPSPYSLGCKIKAPLVCASSIDELLRSDVEGKLLLLHGEIAKEQIMPKKFVFYNPEEHQHIVSLLESKLPAALITATGRNSALAGGAYPFPMFEDGDFDIPSVYMTEGEGRELLRHAGSTISFDSVCERIPSKSYNVIARKGNELSERIVVTAHIDAKKGSPGAIDNATGVIVLLLLGQLLHDYDGDRLIELVALNGEDYYAVPGQMHYIAQNDDNFDNVLLNINIDGAGYKEGKSAFSFFDLPGELEEKAKNVMNAFNGITEGPQWPQGDHSIFVQYGRPALAVSSEWFLDNIETQDITHTPKDNVEIVDCAKVVEIALTLKSFLSVC